MSKATKIKGLTASIGLTAAVAFSTAVTAGPVTGLIDDGTWEGWTIIADDDGTVGPGGGGQSFDTEFLLYMIEGDTLHLGLQTGFDVTDGHQLYSGKNYWGGDLFLSVDGDTSVYEYAIDFGFQNCGYSFRSNVAGCDALTPDALGLYNVDTYNNDVVGGHSDSLPFQMATALPGPVGDVVTTSGAYGDTYFRTASFSLSDLAGFDGSFDVHWTMSCGNDAIDGSAAVPETPTLALLVLGVIGLGFMRRKA